MAALVQTLGDFEYGGVGACWLCAGLGFGVIMVLVVTLAILDHRARRNRVGGFEVQKKGEDDQRPST